MKFSIVALLASCLFILSGCATQQAAKSINHDAVSGHWFGQSVSGPMTTIWLNKRLDGGKFELEFKKCQGGEEVFYQVKKGTWSLDKRIYTTVTTELTDGQHTWQPATPNRQYIEEYTIRRIKNDRLDYSNEEQSYKAYKASANFKLMCGQLPKSHPDYEKPQPLALISLVKLK